MAAGGAQELVWLQSSHRQYNVKRSQRALPWFDITACRLHLQVCQEGCHALAIWH